MRFLKILFVTVCLLGILSFLFWRTILPQQTLKAEILAANTPEEDLSTRLVTLLEKRDIAAIKLLLQNFSAQEEFLQTIKRCQYFTNIGIENKKNGFQLHFLCAEKGDSLHSYFGFFQQK